MKEQSQQLSSAQLYSLFAQLNPLDVEQFYTAYQLWNTRQRIQTLQAQIDDIQHAIVENTEYLEQVHPSALALATLARLQSNGVSDVVMLDRMLERGEEWLDRTMQHLEYCEKLDVISGNYTKWCEHALEGAYDWIDSILGQEEVDAPFAPIVPTASEAASRESNESNGQEEIHENSEPTSEIMEELFLHKLMSDDMEDVEDAELNVLPTEQDTQPEAVDSTPVLAEIQAVVPASEQVQKPEHTQENIPTIYVLAATTSNEIVPYPSPSVEVKQHQGVLRTLIAVLFHI